MIKFFRRIRQKLINERNIRSYLLYAFGEIILVMVGILLALQVNNWNENRLLKNQEKEILSDFKYSLTSDLNEEIDPLMLRFQGDAGRIEKVLELTKKAQHTRDPYIKGKNNGVPVLTHEVNFNPQLTTYKTLESHGVSLIQDKVLRNSILAIYNREYGYVNDFIDNKNENILGYGRPIMRNKFKEMSPEYGFEILDLDIYDDPVFWNYLHNEKRMNRIGLKNLETLVIKIEKLIFDIDRYVNS